MLTSFCPIFDEATALLPVPPALDFGRIAAVLNGEATEDQRRPYEAWCATMQPRAPAERSKEIHSTGFTNKEVLQRLKSPKTPWQSIAQLLLEAQKVRTNLNLVVVTAAIAAYGRSQSWQHALEIFGSCSGLSGLRLDAVAISACVAAVAARWSLALWTLQRGRLMALDPAPRGITSAAMACGQGEWMWSLRIISGWYYDGSSTQLPGGTSCSIQTLTASLMACEKTGRWSTAVAVLCRAVDGRLQADQVAVNGSLARTAGWWLVVGSVQSQG
eukprot:Skav221520  [mRNA]  locus=scaffold1248:113440:115604:- [translate_table: standard]